MYTMRRVDPKDCLDIILNYHYAKRRPSISYAFGFFEDEELVGVLTIGKPASNPLCVGILGEEYKSHVFELNRLCFIRPIRNAPSQLIAFAMAELKSENLVIVSYADRGMNHNGYIYQASNFIYTGATKARTDKYTEQGKHSRHYQGKESKTYRQVRTSKHRYVYFTGSRSVVKKYKKLLRYPVLPYPKEENKNYVLGSEYKQELVKIKGGENEAGK